MLLKFQKNMQRRNFMKSNFSLIIHITRSMFHSQFPFFVFLDYKKIRNFRRDFYADYLFPAFHTLDSSRFVNQNNFMSK